MCSMAHPGMSRPSLPHAFFTVSKALPRTHTQDHSQTHLSLDTTSTRKGQAVIPNSYILYNSGQYLVPVSLPQAKIPSSLVVRHSRLLIPLRRRINLFTFCSNGVRTGGRRRAKSLCCNSSAVKTGIANKKGGLPAGRRRQPEMGPSL